MPTTKNLTELVKQPDEEEAKMRNTVLFARVYSKDQGGLSIPAQLKLVQEYGRKLDIKIGREFSDRPNTNRRELISTRAAAQPAPEDAVKQGVLYSRVGCEESRQKGNSTAAQIKLLRAYARKHSIKVVGEFADVGERKHFQELVSLLRANKECRAVVVEKIDRLWRNFRDMLTLEDLDVEIHLAKEGQIVSKDSKSQANLAQAIYGVVAKNYIDNLREEIKKGMREKAEQGIYPGGHPPLGYRFNRVSRGAELDPETSPLIRRVFELYATRSYSLMSLRKLVKKEFGKVLSLSRTFQILQNPFYRGMFRWGGKAYQGTHPAIVTQEVFDRVQDYIQTAKAAARRWRAK
jgi:DNA invertase Pin-like site-specific DNA recombinase